jgi:hypothetical protein
MSLPPSSSSSSSSSSSAKLLSGNDYRYYLQRAETIPSASDLSRLNSDKLGIFTSADGRLSQASHYNPKEHSPELQPKFYVYTVQRREIFDDDLDDTDNHNDDHGNGNEQQNGDNTKNEIAKTGSQDNDNEDDDDDDDDDDAEDVLTEQDIAEERQREAKVLALQKKSNPKGSMTANPNGYLDPSQSSSSSSLSSKKGSSLPARILSGSTPSSSSLASSSDGKALGNLRFLLAIKNIFFYFLFFLIFLFVKFLFLFFFHSAPSVRIILSAASSDVIDPTVFPSPTT